MNPNATTYHDYDSPYKHQSYTLPSYSQPQTPSYSQPTYPTYLNHTPIQSSLPHDYNNASLSRAPSYTQDFQPHSYLSSPKSHLTSDLTVRTNGGYQSYSQVQSPVKVSHSQGLSLARKQSKGAHLAELNIDEITESSSLHTSPDSNRFAFSAPDKYGLLTPQPNAGHSGISFFTGLKTSQHSETKDRTGLFENLHGYSMNSNRDEIGNQNGYYGVGRGGPTSLLQGLMAPRSPNRGVHIRIPDVASVKTSVERRKDVFLNVKILNCMVQFLNCGDIIQFRSVYFEYRNDREFKGIFKKRLEKLVLSIRSKEDQYKFWNALVDFRKLRNDHGLAFTQHFVRECGFIRDINKDLDRTFPEYEIFSTGKGKDSLLKVLVAISNTIKEVGYIQGLNSIAGVFLFYLKEEESFWILVYMMEKLRIKEIFQLDFQRVEVLNYQLETFVNYYLPSIGQLFNDQPISLSTFTTQWFITLYSYSLSIPNIVKVWNLMFIRGISFLIQFGLAIFSKYKNDILSMSIDEVGTFLKEELRQIDDNEESLFKLALEFRVTKKLMSDLETYYQNGKPKLILAFDSRKKAVWSVLRRQDSDLSPTAPGLPRSQTDPAKLREAKESKDIKKPVRTNSSSTSMSSKSKSPIFFQNLVNTLKIDLPDTLKNIFGKKEPEVPSSLKGSLIEDDRKPELVKVEALEHKELISPVELHNSRQERNDSDTSPQIATRASRDYRSHTVTQKMLHSPKFQSGQFEVHLQDQGVSSVSITENKTNTNPYFGRPKVRPQNNSIDASDLTTFTPEKEFIKQLQINNGRNAGESYRSPFTTNSNSTAIYQEEPKSIYSKVKLEGGFRSPVVAGAQVEGIEDFTAGYNAKKAFDEYYLKKPTVPPKQLDLRTRPYRSDNNNIDLYNPGRPGNIYGGGLSGDYKKI